MNGYRAPLKDMRFVLRELVDIGELAKLEGFAHSTPDTVDVILEEAARFAAEMLDPLNLSGDREGSRWDQGDVHTPRGFREAYARFCSSGWNALHVEQEWGGQGLPRAVSAAVQEMWKSSNLSFSLCPLLTQGAIEALLLGGSDLLKKIYLPPMVDGSWTGTMNLTEPQAGSDLSLVRTRARRNGDHYLISGEKIFVTFGEHDLSQNIVHLVLARTPDAPEGVQGLSLFLVPKFLVDDAGAVTEKRNALRCASIEEKLGIRASPTAVMLYENAEGYLVGEENRGLQYMFIMMNAARFAVGLEGVAIAERAFQRAFAFASDRVQGRDVRSGAKAVPILGHPDVRRMLMLMKSQTEAMRAVAYTTAVALDLAHGHGSPDVRHESRAFADMMIPVVKGWCTETGIEIASLGIQVHGGVGFVEETGAAQLLRDARITTIYEGTTGIQAMDLVGRKIVRDGGATAKRWILSLRELDLALGRAHDSGIHALRSHLSIGAGAVEQAVDFIVGSRDPTAVLAAAVPFLKLMGVVAGGWQMARAALAAESSLSSGSGDKTFCLAKIRTAQFYGDHVLTQARGLLATISCGAEALMAVPDDAMLGS